MSPENLAKKVLVDIFEKYKEKGIFSIYLWGSIITPDYDASASDIDAIGILEDNADFEELDKIRDWLPSVEPKLKRLQINFFYLSELKGGPARSRLARLESPEQAVFDFPNWKFVCGRTINQDELPKVSAQTALMHQIKLTKTKMDWVKNNTYGDMSGEYFCKSLVWLCYIINKINFPSGRFSWKDLLVESTDETRQLVETLKELKQQQWDRAAIDQKLPWLMTKANILIAKYEISK